MLLCGVMMMPCTLEARERNNGGNNRGQQTSQAMRNNNGGNRNSNVGGINRNQGNVGNNNGGNRNGNVGNTNRNQGNVTVNNNNRNNNVGGNRNINVGNVNRNQGNRNVNRGNVVRQGGQPAVRQHLPSPRAYRRPTVPPATYRYYEAWPTFRSILGVALGTTINMTLNALLNNGYTVSSYGTNTVFLTDVPMLNLLWPDATLYYGTGGGLIGSEFVYYTPTYNVNRYNTTYASLIRTYGQPYEVVQLDNGMRATWWGPSNQYIQLTFAGDYALNGGMNYYTTLSFGN
jgi:hypothetical protein